MTKKYTHLSSEDRAVPMETTAEQWPEIMRAMRYAEQQGVRLVPEVVTKSSR